MAFLVHTIGFLFHTIGFLLHTIGLPSAYVRLPFAYDRPSFCIRSAFLLHTFGFLLHTIGLPSAYDRPSFCMRLAFLFHPFGFLLHAIGLLCSYDRLPSACERPVHADGFLVHATARGSTECRERVESFEKRVTFSYSPKPRRGERFTAAENCLFTFPSGIEAGRCPSRL